MKGVWWHGFLCRVIQNAPLSLLRSIALLACIFGGFVGKMRVQDAGLCRLLRSFHLSVQGRRIRKAKPIRREVVFWLEPQYR
jgi:hypothetical protein